MGVTAREGGAVAGDLPASVLLPMGRRGRPFWPIRISASSFEWSEPDLCHDGRLFRDAVLGAPRLTRHPDTALTGEEIRCCRNGSRRGAMMWGD